MSVGHERVSKVILDDRTPVHIFHPATTEKPDRAVVLFHERYGLVQHTLDLAARLADSGMLSLAPDLFEGRVDDYDAVREGRERAVISDDEVVRAAEGCLSLLRTRFAIDPPQTAVMGVCQSGRHAICVANANPDVGAAVVFYGAAQDRDWRVNDQQPIAMRHMLQNLGVPLFATFAERDHVISVENVFRFRGALEQGLRSYVIRLQKDAPHGFMDSTKPGRYRPDATAESWAELMQFLGDKLMTQHNADNDPRQRSEWEFKASISRSYDFSRNVRLE
ncbi:MAG: hypothetical protein GEU81_09260 [Nitriliruptorales bacterium]|nr:hypothetical protein [Nitriliruptorales bacterium]